MKILSATIFTALLLFIAGGSYFFLDILHYAGTPAGTGSRETFVAVHPGEGFGNISEKLLEARVIRDPFKFKLLARVKGYDKKIKSGEYRLSATMTPLQILETVAKGKVFFHKLTVPEGYNIKQIAQAVANLGLGTEKAFSEIATDPSFISEKEIDARTFEGYLFPDTYYLPRGATAKQIISLMVKRFWSVFTPEWKERADLMKLSIHQVITLASIIEKETGYPSERPLISSVFHNRLKRKMRLQSDPTVIYGIKNFDGNITRKHLKTRTAYNTYKIKGLPPGPIANPGKKAIEAALYPADTRFLYFVSKKDRTHKFSTNLKDHNRAVRKYQLR